MPASPTAQQEIRDPIHGFIHFSPVELALLGTPVFQRLRRIHQLGLTHLVYPGTTHTRFEHSIGTMNYAGRLANFLKLAKSQVELVRQAALLHDVGHGPFSHVSENLLDYYSKGSHVHEAISAWIVESDKDIGAIVPVTEAGKIAALLRKEGVRSVERDIVSSRTDADKFDYLLRDSYAAGVKYGVFDVDRLIETAVTIKSGDETQLGFDVESVWALEGLIMARHHMHRQVYGHRTRLVTDAMLVRSMELAIEGGILEKDAFTFQKTSAFLESFLALDDYEVERRILASTGKAHDMMRRLRERRLLKRAYHEGLEELEDRMKAGYYLIEFLNSKERFTRAEIRKVEASVADQLSLSAEEVILSLENADNPTYRVPGYPTTELDIMLHDKALDRDLPLFRVSDVFRDRAEPMRTYINLYLPMESLSPAQRSQLEGRAKKAVTKALDDLPT